MRRAISYIPIHLGGTGFAFSHVPAANLYAAHASLALGSALLPAYSCLLGLIALLGYVSIAVGNTSSAAFGANSAIPDLIASALPGWFAGFAANLIVVVVGSLAARAVGGESSHGKLGELDCLPQLAGPTASPVDYPQTGG